MKEVNGLGYSRILVTGGAGFIGSHLTETLVQEGFDVSVLDNLSSGKMNNLEKVAGKENFHFIKGDIRDVAVVKKALEGIGVVFHEAALLSVILSIQDPMPTNDVNVVGTLNLLKASCELGVKRFIFASSAAVYGEETPPMKTEDMVVSPANPYGVSKLAAESYVKAFSKVYGLEAVSLRYFNVYGPKQSFDLSTGYGGVITIFLQRLVRNMLPTVFGDGEQTRDFVYVGDVVRANMLAMNAANVNGEFFNIGSGTSVSVNHVAETLKRVLGKEQIMNRYEPARVGECRHGYADISKASNILGYKPAFSFEKGIANLATWYNNSLDPSV